MSWEQLGSVFVDGFLRFEPLELYERKEIKKTLVTVGYLVLVFCETQRFHSASQGCLECPTISAGRFLFGLSDL